MQAITKLLKGATAVGAVALGLCFAVTLSTPAAATDIQQAVDICRDTGNCRITPNHETGGLFILVDTSEGPKGVSCPPKGPCSVQSKTPQGGKSSAAGKKGGTYAAGNVAAVLKKRPAAVTRTTTPAVKTGLAVDKKIGMQKTEDRRPRAGAAAVNPNIKTGGGNQPVSLQRSGNSQRSGGGGSKR